MQVIGAMVSMLMALVVLLVIISIPINILVLSILKKENKKRYPIGSLWYDEVENRGYVYDGDKWVADENATKLCMMYKPLMKNRSPIERKKKMKAMKIL